MGFALAQSLLAAFGTFLLCKWLDLSARHRWIWTIFALFAGWGVCLAVVACHRRLVKEACSHCKTPTRVDAETCTQCGKEWLPPDLDQIEIFDDPLETEWPADVSSQGETDLSSLVGHGFLLLSILTREEKGEALL